MKAIAGIFGIIVFITSSILVFGLISEQKRATALDDIKKSYGEVAGDLLPCPWEGVAPERVMSEDTSQAIVIRVKSLAQEDCRTSITLRAPGFDISPMKEEQSVTVSRNSTGSLSWIINPRKTGTYTISLSDMLNTKIYGITVTTVFGLTGGQARIASFLGGLFGPMLTVPWWWDKWRARKKKENTSQIAS